MPLSKSLRYETERLNRAAKMLTPNYAEIYAAMEVGDVERVRKHAAFLVNNADTIANAAVAAAEEIHANLVEFDKLRAKYAEAKWATRKPI